MGPFHQYGLAHRSHLCQLSKLLVFIMFPAMSLLLFPLFHSNSPLILRFWGLFGRFFEGSASVFLLINGVVVSIIASSKMEQSIARGASSGARDNKIVSNHFKISTENQPAAEDIHHKLEMAVEDENQKSQEIIKENLGDIQEKQQKLLIIPDCSCANDEESKTLMEKSGQKDTVRTHQMSPTGSNGAGYGDGAGNAPPSEEAVPSVTEVWAAIAAAKNRDLPQARSKPSAGLPEIGNKPGNNRTNTQQAAMTVEIAGDGSSHAGNPPPSKEEAPSAAEVWAAIMAGKESDKSNGGGGAVAETSQPPAARRSSPAGLGRSRAKEEAEGSRSLHGEVDELNRRAEEFIARFNEQMRLQRLESLRRRRAQRRGGHRLRRHPGASKGPSSRHPDLIPP